jgi:DNA invertase Pin-like site-specific DNA recombinase
MSQRASATPKQVAKARKLIAANVPISEIIKRTGLTRRQVSYACRDLPTPKHPREWDCADVQAIVDKLAAELGHVPSASQVGDLLGVTRQRAHALMQRCRIPRAKGSPSVAKTIERDTEIIALCWSGESVAEIANRVGCSETTVRRVIRSAGVS